MTRLSIAACVLLLSSMSMAQTYQGWTDNQSAQDDPSGTAFKLIFPRGNPVAFPGGAIHDASIYMIDNSATVFDAMAFSGVSIPRITATGGQDFILGAETGRILIVTNAISGTTQFAFSQPAPIGGFFEDDVLGVSFAVAAGTAANQSAPFFYVGAVPGTPTGVPIGSALNGTDIAMVWDHAHNILYCYDNGAWQPCDPSGGTGTVTTVTGTPPIFITSTPTTTPNVTIQGAIVSGSTSTSGQNIGAISTAPLGCVTSGGVCTVDGLTLAGGLHFNTGTGTETLDSFTCGANTFVSSSSTSGLACTQPSFANLSGSATCAQLPALTGGVTSSAGSCATTVASVPCAALPALTGAVSSSAGSCATTVNFSGLTGSANCSQLPALTGDTTSTAGTCGTQTVALRDGTGVRWPTSGTWSNNDVLITAAGDIFAAATIACGNLPAFSGGALTSAGGTCNVGLVPSAVAAATTKLRYSLQLQLGSNTPNTWLLQGGAGLFTNGAVIEVPNDFKASSIQVTWYLRSNVITAGTLSLFATLNGSAIAGTGFSLTSATSTGVHVGTSLSTGSSSASDTYGLVFTTDVSYAATSPSSEFLTVEIVLTP